MLQEQNIPKRASMETEKVAASRRCAFYQAAMQPTIAAPSGDEARTLRHSCLLNPGKTLGPDGNKIGPLDCTLARQAQCQAERRQGLARLHAALRSLRDAASADASG